MREIFLRNMSKIFEKFLIVIRIGGVILTNRKRNIKCINTFRQKIDLVYAESIPDIRNGLFPSLAEEQARKMKHAAEMRELREQRRK